MDICKKIAELINQNGRQGPKDIVSREVYDWIEGEIALDYPTYRKIILDNSAAESQRQTDRNRYFIAYERGIYGLFKSNEEEIRPYLYMIIARYPNRTSDEILHHFKLIYRGYTYVDKLKQKNLTGNQDIIDQTVRNILVSNYDNEKNRTLFIRNATKPYRYQVLPGGLVVQPPVFQPPVGDKPYSREQLAQKTDNYKNYNAMDHVKTSSGRTYYDTDPRLKSTRIAQVGRCEHDKLHQTFFTPSLKMYLEGHHMVPMAYQSTYSHIQLDRIENIVALCPTCHRQIHYGHSCNKRKIIAHIFNERMADLSKMGFNAQETEAIFEDMVR